jgi:DNA polymerase-1
VSNCLLPGWAERIAANHKDAQPAWSPPLAAAPLAGRVTFVDDTDPGRTLVQAAHELPLACIGMDSEFRYREQLPLRLPRDKDWWDVRTRQPFCLALALLLEGRVLAFVVDVRVRALWPLVQEVLDLPVPFVCHLAPAELFTLWTLGLREPRTLWDTYLAEKALGLGRCRQRAKARRAADDQEAAQLSAQAKQEEEQRLGLDRVAARYGLPGRQATAKEALQGSFLTKPLDAPLTAEEVAYCAEDTRLTVAIREPQRIACDRAGLTETLDRVVMPWNVTAAEIAWTGVRFDEEKCRLLREGAGRARQHLTAELAAHGIPNPGSSVDLDRFLRANGLAGQFPPTKTGRLSTRDKVLREREGLHAAIPLVRRWRKLGQLISDPAVNGLITAADGRVHAEFCVLGSDTGRTQSSCPNLMGIGRVFRPLVRASEGYGIGDVDLAQIEVGIAAAVFRDGDLVHAFNQDDVYVALAKIIFAAQLAPGDLALDPKEFKRKHKRLRDQSKSLVLGIIYGKTVEGIARELKIPLAEARSLWEAFRRRYPTICRRMEAARVQSARRGYAYMSGLRRFRAGAARASAREGRELGNAYVQGTAALVFFDAGNRLRRLYRGYQARLVIPVHDAFVFEAPLGVFPEVAELTRRVLVQTVQEWFPELRPRAEINISQPGCWNHEGHADSVERFLENPMLVL